MTPANFAHYEHQYRERRSAGGSGWLTAAGDDEVFDLVRLLLARAGLTGGRVLELGCGAGNISRRLAGCGFDLLGVDMSPTAVAWAAEQSPAARSPRYRVLSATRLDALAPELFDVVLDGLCLHALIGPDRATALRQAAARLRPGGAFLLLTMCNEPVPPRFRRVFDRETRTIRGADGVAEVCLLPADHILAELRSAGFRTEWSDVRPGNADRSDQDLLLAVGKTPGPAAYPPSEARSGTVPPPRSLHPTED